jgi:hypothetical protein
MRRCVGSTCHSSTALASDAELLLPVHRMQLGALALFSRREVARQAQQTGQKRSSCHRRQRRAYECLVRPALWSAAATFWKSSRHSGEQNPHAIRSVGNGSSHCRQAAKLAVGATARARAAAMRAAVSYSMRLAV